MKYHIFIGSTLDDLKSERRELPRIVTELGHTPVMADFLDGSAGSVSKLLQKTIEECDYFIALVAHRYGGPDGISPLFGECAVAARKGIPVLALIIDDKARWKPAKRETDETLVRRLDEFKSKLRGGPFATWSNIPDLCQKAQSLIVQELSLNSRPGWVRADRIIDPTVANEISRLSSENDDLRRRIVRDDGASFAKLQDEEDRALKVLALNKVTLSFYYAPGDNWESPRQFRYIRIFKILVPELVLGKTTSEISRFLGTVLNPDLDRTVRRDYPTPSNSIKKIMTDFSLLKLVKCTHGEEKHADNEVWEITEYGKELYSAYRMRQLDRALVKKADGETA